MISVSAPVSPTSGPKGPLVGVPHLLTAAVVRRVVAPSPGAYVLGHVNLAFAVGYVGRSDRSVRDRLVRHERLEQFDYFIVRYTNRSDGAYLVECSFWHSLVESGRHLANLIHPAAPRGLDLECPYCHFAKHACRLLGVDNTLHRKTPMLRRGGTCMVTDTRALRGRT